MFMMQKMCLGLVRLSIIQEEWSLASGHVANSAIKEWYSCFVPQDPSEVDYTRRKKQSLGKRKTIKKEEGIKKKKKPSTSTSNLLETVLIDLTRE